MAAAIPAQAQACMKAIKESIGSHNVSLKPGTVHEFASKICQNFDVKRIALFCAISHRCMGIGRFCLIHNHKLDVWLEEGNAESLEKLLAWIRKGRQMCTEIFDNAQLTPEEVAALKNELVTEYNSVRAAIVNYNDSGKDEPLMPCKKPSSAYMAFDGIRYTGERSMVEKCHGTVCSASGSFPAPLNLNRIIFLIDHPPDRIVPTLYDYDQLELLCDLVPENPSERINRFSGKSFRSDSAESIRNSHMKEIKMIKRYHIWLEEPDEI